MKAEKSLTENEKYLLIGMAKQKESDEVKIKELEEGIEPAWRRGFKAGQDELMLKLTEKGKEITELKETLKFNENARDIDFAEIERLKKDSEQAAEQALSDFKSQLRERIIALELSGTSNYKNVDGSIIKRYHTQKGIVSLRKVLELLEEK